MMGAPDDYAQVRERLMVGVLNKVLASPAGPRYIAEGIGKLEAYASHPGNRAGGAS